MAYSLVSRRPTPTCFGFSYSACSGLISYINTNPRIILCCSFFEQKFLFRICLTITLKIDLLLFYLDISRASFLHGQFGPDVL